MDETTLVIEVKVPTADLERWVEFCTRYADLFGYNYCGYWACGVKKIASGWVLRDAEAYGATKEGEDEAAIAAAVAGKPLPNHYYLLDKDAAIKAYRIGVACYGKDWEKTSDATTYDVLIQRALLGRVVYG